MKHRTMLLVTALVCWAIMAVVVASMVWGSPYLTCDCTPAVDAITGFQLQLGTATPIDVPIFTVCETETPCVAPSYRICWDAAQLPAGPFSIKALSKNAWGVSNWTLPLAGSKSLPTSPILLKMVP